jgi:hypothetical protein
MDVKGDVGMAQSIRLHRGSQGKKCMSLHYTVMESIITKAVPEMHVNIK